MDALFADLRFAIRQIRYAPAFAVTAILTLALGIGANSALYTVADAILRKARPGVGESSSLVWVASTDQARSRPAGVSYQVAARVRAEVPLFERVSTIREIPLSLSAQGDPVKVKGQAVSGDYFAMLRASFFLGRGITPADDAEPGLGSVVVLNHRTWQSSFGADSAIVGRKILLNGLAFTVIGVTAPSFNGAAPRCLVREDLAGGSAIRFLLRRDSPPTRGESRRFVHPGLTKAS